MNNPNEVGDLATHQHHLDALRQHHAPADLIQAYEQWIEAGYHLAWPQDEHAWRIEGQALLERVMKALFTL